MSALNSLKFVPVLNRSSLDRSQVRRGRLVDNIDRQIEFCQSLANGVPISPTKESRRIFDPKTDAFCEVESSRKPRLWFWLTETKSICLTIRYGNQIVPLGRKGSHAIECKDYKGTIDALKAVKNAILSGELDDAITEACKATREAFKR